MTKSRDPGTAAGGGPAIPLPRRPLSREERLSLALHEAVARHLRADPDRTLEHARANLERWEGAAQVPMTANWLRRWREVLAHGADATLLVLLGTEEEHVDLRQNSPFAGVLDEQERRAVLEQHAGGGGAREP